MCITVDLKNNFADLTDNLCQHFKDFKGKIPAQQKQMLRDSMWADSRYLPKNRGLACLVVPPTCPFWNLTLCVVESGR